MPAGSAMRLSPIDAPPLTTLEAKIADPRWLVAQLTTPHRLRATPIMPDYVLPVEEAWAIAGYLYARPAPPRRRHWTGGDARRGENLFTSRGCRACHGSAPNERGASLRVPDLSGVGIKVRADWLYDWLESPRAYNPQTSMPRLALSAGEIRDLVAFLLTRRAGAEVLAAAPRLHRRAPADAGRLLIERYRCSGCHEIRGFPAPVPRFQLAGPSGTPTEALQRGRVLIHQYNCRGCHRIEGQGGAVAEFLDRQTLAPPSLDGEGARVQTSWLVRFLQRPETLRPWLGIRMPDFGFSEAQARALAEYWAALDNVPSVDEVHPTADRATVARGLRRFAHFKCVQCHSSREALQPPEDLELEDLSLSLTLTKTRLRPSWLRDFLARPKQIAGIHTRMPTVFYTVDGVPKVERPARDIEAIAAYLLEMSEPPETSLARMEAEQQRELPRPTWEH